MLEFLTQWGYELLAGLLGTAGAAVSVVAVWKVYKLSKKLKAQEQITREDIKVTKEGVVEAFKTATIPDNIKVSINNKVEEVLGNFRDEMISKFQRGIELTQNMQFMILKILMFTAASAKLTDEERAYLQEIINKFKGEETPTIETQ